MAPGPSWPRSRGRHRLTAANDLDSGMTDIGDQYPAIRWFPKPLKRHAASNMKHTCTSHTAAQRKGSETAQLYADVLEATHMRCTCGHAIRLTVQVIREDEGRQVPTRADVHEGRRGAAACNGSRRGRRGPARPGVRPPPANALELATRPAAGRQQAAPAGRQKLPEAGGGRRGRQNLPEVRGSHDQP